MTGVWKVLSPTKMPNTTVEFILGHETEKLLDMMKKQPRVLPEEIPLVKLSVGELGCESGDTLGSIYTAAELLGLMLCPASLGILLRAHYDDQPLGEQLNVAMNPIGSSHIRNSFLNGRLIQEKVRATAILCLGRPSRRDDPYMLYLRGSSMQTFWKSDTQFVFVLNASRK